MVRSLLFRKLENFMVFCEEEIGQIQAAAQNEQVAA
jgi:hypothetical protein